MRYALSLIVTVSWALWFGGTLALFVFAPYVLHHTESAVAGPALGAMFVVFSKYALILAGVSVFAAGMLMITYPSKSLVLLVGTLIVAGGMGITVGLGLIPHMEALREEGKQATPEWKKYHGKSMMALSMQAGMLLLGGACLIASKTSPKQKVPTNTPVPTLPPGDPEYEPMFNSTRSI